MTYTRQSEKKEIILDDKIRGILKYLDDAIRAQSLEDSSYFKELTEAKLDVEKTVILPALTLRLGMPSEKLLDGYLNRLNKAIISVGYDSKHTEAGQLKHHFVVIRELLLRLTRLMFTIEGDCKKWLAVYKDFSDKLTQSRLLYVGFINKTESLFDVMLKDQATYSQFELMVNSVDMLYKDTTNLSDPEKDRIARFKTYTAHHALINLSAIGRELPELIDEEGVELAMRVLDVQSSLEQNRTTTQRSHGMRK